MNKKLERQLLTKYPKLLVNLRYKSFETDEGWNSLISNMLEELQNYIDNPVRPVQLNSFHYWWNRRWYAFIWPIVSDDGFKKNWPSLVKFANDKLRFDYYTSTPIEQVTIRIIKSKFGSLRIQGVSGGDDITKGIIKFHEKMSDHICETCGTTNKVKHVLNKDKWEKTLCPDCAKEFKSE
jgi:hypothetical protein